MAVLSDLIGVTVNMKLNNGTDSQGQVKTLNQSIGKLNIDRYDDQKAMNIVNLAEPCLAKPVYEVRKVATSILSESD